MLLYLMATIAALASGCVLACAVFDFCGGGVFSIPSGSCSRRLHPESLRGVKHSDCAPVRKSSYSHSWKRVCISAAAEAHQQIRAPSCSISSVVVCVCSGLPGQSPGDHLPRHAPQRPLPGPALFLLYQVPDHSVPDPR